MIVKNARLIVKGNETKIQDILIKKDKIISIADFIEHEGEEVIDAEERLVLPGGVDVHVHLREPGFTKKETIKTGSIAAARGGYTTIMAMPNIIPYPDNVEMIKKYQELIRKDALVKVLPYACITKQEEGLEVVDMKAISKLGIAWFSDDGVGLQQDNIMEEAMKKAKTIDAMIVAHTEDMNYRKPMACIHDGVRAEELGLLGIPSICEYKQIERDLQLALKTNVKYHICHMSAKESICLLRKYKALGANVSGEVTTHHLLLNENNVENTNHKMNPPLRSEEDRQALIEGLLDGTIDFIANDHAPHSEVEKDTTMEKAPFGIVALETSIPLIYTKFVKTGIFTLEQFQDYISRKPAKRFGLKNIGELKEGFQADIIILSEDEQQVHKETFISKGKNTPFDGYRVNGNIVVTLVNGIVVYNAS